MNCRDRQTTKKIRKTNHELNVKSNKKYIFFKFNGDLQ